MKNNKKILSGFLLAIIILTIANLAFALPITGRVIEISAIETKILQDPIKACTACIGGTDTGQVDSDGCPIYSCPAKICPVDCICDGDTITCPTTQQKPIEVEIFTSEGSISISVEKVAEDSISITEGLTLVKTSKKLVIEEKKLLMETSQGNKEVKIMPSTASDIAINQLQLKNYEIELKDVGKPVYEITGTKEVKVIGFINAEMAIKSQIDAETGIIEKTEKPWWSFLAKE